MSKVKSFSVGNGDMFYIKHDSDSFTIIDCCLNYGDYSESNKKRIIDEIRRESIDKGIRRFISTHPDEGHISGLSDLDEALGISNFYCVKNNATKNEDSIDFEKYKQLRDDSSKQFELKEGCSRLWLNQSDNSREGAGLTCLWSITSNKKYKEALTTAEAGGKPNNICPVIKYDINGFSFLWMGDMEQDMQEEFDRVVQNSPVTIVFAPHHGRQSGSIPTSLLKKLSPQLVVIGEAPCDELNYYNGQNTITQNTAGDILFEVHGDFMDIFVSNNNYTKSDLIHNSKHKDYADMEYLGSITKK